MENVIIDERLLTPKETAQLLRVKPQTLAVWRCKGKEKDLSFVRVGGRVMYKYSDIKEYLNKR